MASAGTPIGNLAMGVICVVVAVQCALPFRHFLIPGEVGWTLEGSRYAWRMKASGKSVGPFSMRIEDAGLDDAELGELPVVFDLAGGEPHNHVPHTARFARFQLDILRQIVALVQKAERGDAIFHRRADARCCAYRRRRLIGKVFGNFGFGRLRWRRRPIATGQRQRSRGEQDCRGRQPAHVQASGDQDS